MSSTIDKELLQFFSLLNEQQKESLLQMMETFLPYESGQEGTDIYEYNRELREALTRIENGEFTSLENFEMEMNKW